MVYVTTDAKAPLSIAEHVRRQRAWVRVLARELVGGQDADDVAQDAWMAALERGPEERASIRPWLATVVRRLASGLRRGRARRNARELDSARPEAQPSTADLVERVDTERRMTQALLELEEPYRETLLLRYHEGLRAVEVARRLGVPEGTVRWRAKRGLELLRARLERELGGREVLGLSLLSIVREPRPVAPVAAPISTTAKVTTIAATAGGSLMASKGLVAAGIALAGAALWIGLARDPGEGPRGSEPEAPGERSGLASTSPERVAHDAPSAPAVETLVRPSEGTPLSPARLSASTDLRVLDVDGRPLAHRLVVLGPGASDEALAKWTDAGGRASFPATGERRVLAIERKSGLPFRTELELVPGERVVRLTRGAVLAGRVLVDGAPPRRVLDLEVHATGGAAVDALYDADDPRSLLSRRDGAARTDEDGRFRIEGLADGRVVSLRFPAGYALAGTVEYHDPGEGPLVRFEEPAEGLVVELERHVVVHGRVVDETGSTPIPGALVEVQMKDGIWGRQSEQDGTFEIYVREAPQDVRVRYGRNVPGVRFQIEGSGSAAFHFDDPGRDVDLGDLVVEAGAGLELWVRDPDGRPVAGAVAGVGAPTDEEGRTLLRGVAAGQVLRVGRFGYASERLTVSDPVPSALAVVLVPTNRLTIVVRGEDGEPLGNVELELSAEEWFLLDDPFESREDLLARMSFEWTSRSTGFEGNRGSVWGGSPSRVRYRTSPVGRVSLSGVVAGLSLRLLVLDVTGAILDERELEPFEAAEERVVEVRLPVQRRVLLGRVVDEQGEPILDADVRVAPPGEEDARRATETDARGRFELPLLGTRELRLVVSKRGYLPLVLDPLAPPEDELELVLHAGSALHVRAVDAGGQPHVGGSVRARRIGRDEPPGDWVQAEAVADGLFELVGLDDAPHLVELVLEAGTLASDWDLGRDEILFQVPALGSVEMSWVLIDDPRAVGTHGHHVRFEPADGRRAATTVHLSTAPGGSDRFELFAGDYRAVLVAGRADEKDPAKRVDLDWKPLQVVAGETARLVFGP